MNLSKSKYCKGIQCQKILWLDEYKSEEASVIDNETVLDNGTNVGVLAKDLFGFHFDVSFNENLSEMIKDTKALLLNKNVIITEASFNYNNNFCSVDILKKDNDNYEIYEVKSSTEVKDIYVEDLSYQVYILKSLGYNVTKASLVYINKYYIKKGNLDLTKLFVIEDYTNVALSKMSEIAKKIEEINTYTNTSVEPFSDIDIKCFNPYPCPYFKYCSGNLDKESVFSLRGLSYKKKIEFYKKNIYKYEDLLKSDLPSKYKMQIDFEVNNKEPLIDKDKVKEFLKTLTYPIYFLDFETFQTAVPIYDGTYPYEQIPFQYSLHYEKSNNLLEHKEFLANPGEDPRRTLAQKLVKDIPKNTCVLAYNMAFEKTIIKRLADTYPDLKEHLLNIRENIKDLMTPFYNKSYYTKEMHGSYSIKYVLPALFPNDPSLNYQNLDQVHNGSEASQAYLKMNECAENEKSKIRNDLLKYCELDTLAMVRILNKLKEVVEFEKI